MLTPKLKRLLSQTIPISIIWLVTSWVFLWTEYAIIGSVANTPDSAIAITPKVIWFANLSVAFIGFLVGIIEFAFINTIFQRYSFFVKLIGKLLFYIMFMELIIFITYLIAASIELQESIFSEAVWDKYVLFFTSITHITTVIQLLFSLLLSVLYVETSENLGHSVLINFFTGRYHKPKEETRLFMFSDMKSSTEIAETLGHKTYFEFLKAYYNDLSEAILRHKGEVYQYVGDEIVLTWRRKTKNYIPLSLDCFFAMKQALAKREEFYLKRYGVVPDFKAAIHIGDVTTGEIGALKKDIFFTGDVLNTTARMQSKCNAYNVDLLLSKAVVEGLSATAYHFRPIDTVTLKGKQIAVELYTVMHPNSN